MHFVVGAMPDLTKCRRRLRIRELLIKGVNLISTRRNRMWDENAAADYPR